MDTLAKSPGEGLVSQLPYLLFTVGQNIYGINSEFVRSIEILKNMINITGTENNTRGGVIYQDQFIPLTDMRSLFGLDSIADEFGNSVRPEQRIKDHENWVSELEKSVHNRTELMLTDDPHQCAFGRWYYSFKTDSNVLKHQLSAIEAPHEAVHNTAKVVKQLMKEGQSEKALEAINDMRCTHYKETLRILNSLREIVVNSIKEQYIVIDTNDGMKGIIIDSIVGVEHVNYAMDMPENISNKRFIKFLARRKSDDSLIMILNDII